MGVFQQFLNTVDEAAGVPIVQKSNPVNWSGLGQAIVSSLVAAVAVGVTNIFGAAGDAYTDLLTGLTEFFVGWTEPAQTGLISRGGDVAVPVGGFLDATVGALADVAYGFWDFNIEQFGIFAAPVTVLIVLIVFYVMSVGYRESINQLMGGS